MSSRNYNRKLGNRQPRQAVAILSEGEVTEVEYITFLISKLGIPKELIQITPSVHSDPKGLVDDAVAAKKKNERDAKRKGSSLIENWWVLADTEGTRPGLNEAAQKAKDNGIWFGLCDPSIEFWLLLHFRYTTQGYGSVKELIHVLKSYLPTYDSHNKHLDMNVLFPLLPDAMQNAVRLRKNHTSDGYGSPRTDFDLLVAEINCQAGKGRELFAKERPDRSNLSMFKCGF